jgi:hypothetical protein
LGRHELRPQLLHNNITNSGCAVHRSTNPPPLIAAPPPPGRIPDTAQQKG